jgi:hypothetical protein
MYGYRCSMSERQYRVVERGQWTVSAYDMIDHGSTYTILFLFMYTYTVVFGQRRI